MSKVFDGIVPFVVAAKHLSFSAAGRELGVSTAAVSKAVRRLEDDLGTPLFRRTTRRVALTSEGEMFLAKCDVALAALTEGRARIARAQAEVAGTIVVSATFVLGRYLTRMLPGLVAAHPGLEVDLRLTDQYADLVAEGVDVALRVGPLEDSALISRKLVTTRWATVVAPECAAEHGEPETIEALAPLPCLRFRSPRGRVVPWSFAGHEPVAVEGPFDVDRGDLLIDAALAGMGVAQVFGFMAREHLESGRLKEVLAELAAPGPSIYAVFLPGDETAPKVRAFVDWLVESLG